MKNLIILGAGGASYNIVEYIDDINEVSPTWNLIGLLDDNASLIGTKILDYPVIGSVDDAGKWKDAMFISSVGSARDLEMRKKIREKVPFGDERFATIIHPLAHVSQSAIVGTGCIVCPYSSLQAGTVIGHDSYITSFTLIGHQSKIGNHCVITGRTMIAGKSDIGDCTYIGCGSALSHQIKIGDHCMIGMGSVLWKDVKPYTKMYAPHARTRIERENEKVMLKG
mgnify:CR=1 FL=1